jgi:hypothetical protein
MNGGRQKPRCVVEKPQAGGHTLYFWQPSAELVRQGQLPRRLAEHTCVVNLGAPASRRQRLPPSPGLRSIAS